VSGKPVSWHALAFQPQAYEGFDLSLDLFGDGSLVLVPLFGHTPGSMGVFLTVSSGRRFLFVGDVSWSAAAVAQGQPKFWAARALVDGDAGATAAAISKIRALIARDPKIVIVPAHDSVVQDGLGYFPKWID
jgi:glyoxylase-like metal-dependent hydrolase (beta-lactamase superfamily II)